MTNWLQALPLRWHITGAGVFVLAVSGLFGGLDPVAAARSDVPRISLGDTVEAGPWRVKVTGITLISEAPPIRVTNKGDHLLAVLATVEVTADSTRSDLYDIVRLRGVGGLRTDEPKFVWMRRDGAYAQHLQPGLPEDIAFFWEQAPTATNAAALEVEVFGKTYRENTLTYSNRRANKDWLDRRVHATLLVPVKDNRGVQP